MVQFSLLFVSRFVRVPIDIIHLELRVLCVNENCSVKTRQSELLRYALIMAMLLISGSVFAAVHRWGTESVPFSKAGWESKADLGDRWPMAQNLIETGCLRGMTEPEVLQMLGKEDNRDADENGCSPGDVTLTYVACGRLRFGVLHVDLKNGHVVSAKVTSMD